uniref:EF-hand domain-containing protein n=1 Tax=Chaetoceros debilis TaxID=122233 RepID=A0A7S3Q0N4_9STRA|mmetsp:Transcript_22642/g.34537  ORF Transcript_22642/g.34537 Transcript_22642/m.34537 type:complete len:594 (+) Transcript_22642:166-1947(+)
MAPDFNLASNASEPLKEFVKALRPYSEKSSEGKLLRKLGFAKADSNGTGQVSLAEIDGFVLSVLNAKCGDNDDGGKDEMIFRLYRPSFRHAFNNAKRLKKTKSDNVSVSGSRSGSGRSKNSNRSTVSTASVDDDYVNFQEFRMCTIYLQIYAAMFDIFSSVDGQSAGRTADDDARVSLHEFVNGFEDTKKCSFKGLDRLTSADDAVKLFQSIDTNNGGFILFTEWAEYLKMEEIKAKTHIGTLLSGKIKSTQLGSPQQRHSSSIQNHSTIKSAFKRPGSAATSVASISSRTTISSKMSHTKSSRKVRIAAVPNRRNRVDTRRGYYSRNSYASSSYSNASSSYGSKRSGTGNSTTNSKGSKSSSSEKLSMHMPEMISGMYKPSINTSEELQAFVKSFQPYGEKMAECVSLRRAGFVSCDNNGSGKCSLAEVDSFINDVLKKDYGPIQGTKIFRAFRPSYIVAYKGARGFKGNASGNLEDYISFSEFRIFNAYLCVYAGMLDSFSRIDGKSAGVDANDDRRVDKSEWIKQYPTFTASGFMALQNISNDEFAQSEFESMDADGQGVVLFSEFCKWITAAEISQSTALGRLLVLGYF